MSHSNNPFWHLVEEHGSCYMVDLHPRVVDYHGYVVTLPRRMAKPVPHKMDVDPEQLRYWDVGVEVCVCDCADHDIVIFVPEMYSAAMRLKIAEETVREHFEKY